MGFADRDYNRVGNGSSFHRGSSAVGRLRMLSVTTWLIIINVAVFIAQELSLFLHVRYIVMVPVSIDGVLIRYQPTSFPVVEGLGFFSVGTAIHYMQFWRFLTFQFLHANTTHLALNMIGLFFFGPLVEEYLGSRKYLLFYLLCGISGAVAYMILWATHILISNPWTELIGASAGIFGVLIASAVIAPDATVLIYGIIPMRLRIMALVLLAVAAYTVIFQGNNAGGEAAHLGGAALGFLLIKQPRILDLLMFRRPRRAITPY